MLFWQLPLLSVVFSNPHQTVVTNKERQNNNNNSNSNNNPHQNVVTNNKERQKRAVFDMIPTLKQDRRCRTKNTAAATPSEERTKTKLAAPSEERMKFESDGKICPGDKIGRRRSILKITKAVVERRKLAPGNNKGMKKLLRKIFLKKTVAKKEKKYALRAHEKITKENQKKAKSKMSVKDLIMRGMPSVVGILLKIG